MPDNITPISENFEHASAVAVGAMSDLTHLRNAARHFRKSVDQLLRVMQEAQMARDEDRPEDVIEAADICVLLAHRDVLDAERDLLVDEIANLRSIVNAHCPDALGGEGGAR